MDSHSIDVLSVRGRPQHRNKNKSWGGGGYLNLKVDLNPQENI
jgi:hypothetical protein